MGISAKVILDSVNYSGNRITTFELCFHRFILPEFNTHRAFSRNLASSRAIPVKKMIDSVLYEPAMPIYWGKNQSGMQASEQLEGDDLHHSIGYWEAARKNAIGMAQGMDMHGAHKQLVNRLLEPFSWVRAVVTATDYSNFFDLRCHKDAQPEIQALAREMHLALNESKPQKLAQGEWHIPYLMTEDDALPLEDKLLVSAARCASVSYKTVDDNGIIGAEKARDIWDKLINSKPAHASPIEHQARAGDRYTFSRNFSGFTQYRDILGL